MKMNLVFRILNYVKARLLRKGTIIFISRDLDNIYIVDAHLTITYKFLDQSHLSNIATNDYLSTNQINSLFNRQAKCLGAFERDKLVGYVWVQYMPTYYPFFNYEFNFANDAYVGPDYVFPPYRGKKIHGALLSYIFKYLKDEGYSVAWTGVWTNNLSSIKGLTEVGYKPELEVTAIRILNQLIYRKIKKRSDW